MQLIGLDCSSTCCGISIWSETGVLEDLKALSFKLDKGIDEEQKYFKKVDMLLNELKQYQIKTLFIEEALKGSNNTNTVLTLNAFNGMVRYGIYKEFGIIPITISVNESRKMFLPEYVKTTKVKGCVKSVLSIPKELDKKELVRQRVCEYEPNLIWELNKNSKIKDSEYDRSDAYCVGWSGLKMLGIK